MNLKSIILFSLLVFSFSLLGQNNIIPSPTEYIESGGELFLNKKITINSNSIPKAVHDFLKERNVKIKPDYEIKGFGKDFEQSKIQSENRKVTVIYEIIKIPEPKTKEANIKSL